MNVPIGNRQRKAQARQNNSSRMGTSRAEPPILNTMNVRFFFSSGAAELEAEPVRAFSKSQWCRYPNRTSGPTQMRKTATPMATLATGALGRKERYGRETVRIRAATIRS